MNVLYIFNIKNNLLFIIIFDKKNYEIRFINQRINIIQLFLKRTIIYKNIKNDLYQLNNSIFNKVFLFINIKFIPNEITITKFISSYDNFQRMYKRLGYTEIYRLRDLYKHAIDVKKMKLSDHFQCDICDAIKIIQTINREIIFKKIELGVRLYIDF